MTKSSVLGFFLLINLFSPWVWMVARNPAAFKVTRTQFYQFNSHERLMEINTLRGRSKWSRLIVNKFTWNAKEMLSRAVETFDLHYLVLEGDLDLRRTTGKAGPILLTMVPFMLIGFGESWLVPIILASAVAGLFEPHFFTPARIPLFLIFSWLAAVGICRKKVGGWYWALVVFEFSRFAHYFWLRA